MSWLRCIGEMVARPARALVHGAKHLSNSFHPDALHALGVVLALLVIGFAIRGATLFPDKLLDVTGATLVFLGAIATALGAALPDSNQAKLSRTIKELRMHTEETLKHYKPDVMLEVMGGVADALESLTDASSMARLGLGATSLGSVLLLVSLFVTKP